MNFELSEELKLLQNSVRNFVRREILPREREMPEGDELPPQLLLPWQGQCRSMGLWLLDVPKKYGGAELKLLDTCVIWGEVFQVASSAVAEIFGPEVRPSLLDCRDDQKEYYLLPVLRMEKKACFALTEPDAGTDAASIRTSAVKDGHDYIINGVKRFITGAERAAFAQVFAVTDPQKRARGGITCFLVDMNTPGVKLSTAYDTLMGVKVWEFTLDDVRVNESKILGEVGQGFQLAQKWLTVGRLRQSVRCLGMAQRSLDMAVMFSKQRTTFGRPLADRQAIQWMLADSAIDVRASHLLIYDSAARYDEGKPVRSEVAISKVFTVEMASRVIDRSIQIHGGIGLTKELPLERFYREARRYRITEGTTEIMRQTISRELLS